MLARCSMTVVTMWLPFSLYISATPLRARLLAPVPPEVKTCSFGSRAPISVAILARGASTAPSASHPNGWLRLAGCPNFSVKYGSIASTTRGSHGVVDCASMKIGNFSPIVLSSTLFVSSPRTAGPQPRDVLRLALPVRKLASDGGAPAPPRAPTPTTLSPAVPAPRHPSRRPASCPPPPACPPPGPCGPLLAVCTLPPPDT